MGDVLRPKFPQSPNRPWFQDRGVREAMGSARESDRRIERAAKAAADEMAGGKAKRRQVDPALHMVLAAEADVLAAQARAFAEKLKSYGHLSHCNTMQDLADIAELMACEIEAETKE